MGRLRTVTLPDWPQLRERMLAPKPPIAFTAYAIGRDPLKVRYDGDGTFRIAETGTQARGRGLDHLGGRAAALRAPAATPSAR